jgi:hypothetical protein
MENLLQQVQTFIDDNKENVKEGSYIEVCKTMKHIFENNNEKKFYKTTIVYPKIHVHPNDIFSISLDMKKIIVKLPQKTFNMIKKCIEEHSMYPIDLSCSYTGNHFVEYLCDIKHYVECEECTEEKAVFFSTKNIFIKNIEEA